MRVVILMSVLLIGCSSDNPKDDVQLMNIKSVKGGGSYQYRGGDNLHRFYNNTQYGYGYGQINHTSVNHEVGVCYIEVPTATLVRDPKHIPAGNGSRPDLSRIRTCCAGYIRNIHNFRICDPVCSTECVNALCTAPDTCTCFPDHVKNLAGFCVATCPIGCQNGHCSGGECLCKEGFKLDINGRFCMPHCRENCGGIGNCTAPNTCACSPGYSSTPEGSCRPGPASPPGTHFQPGAANPGTPLQLGIPGTPQQCGSCINGQCVGTECRCRPGHLLYKGECKALCNPNCGPNTECVAPNICAPKPAPGVNGTQHNNPYPNNPQYPYTNLPQNTTYQNPSQYPNGQYPQNQNQYPYPSSQTLSPGNQPHGGTNGQYPNNYQGQYPTPIYATYPGPVNQYSGQPNGYPHQPYPAQPNGTNYPNQDPQPQQPGHQHLYPDLPSSNYPHNPQNNIGRFNGTDGQVYYQNPQYNPLENVTFNLQQGRMEQAAGQGQNSTQGQQHYAGGQFSQGQFGQEHSSHGQSSQGQYDEGRFSQGHYGQGQYNQGQFSQGQYGHGQYSQGQYGQAQYGQGQYDQGQYHQGQLPSVQQGPYGQYVPNVQPGSQMLDPGVPHCEQSCLNGNCVGLNTCQCFPGYNLDPADPTGTRCLPQCPGGCLNGLCSAPNHCVCNIGYSKDFSVKGRSACVKRVRRSAEEKPVDVADLLVFEIPDYLL